MEPLLPVSLLPWLVGALVVGGGIGALLATQLGWQIVRRRRAEDAAQRARADLLPLAQALRHSAEAVVVTDSERRITWVNDAFERITGYRAVHAIGQRPGALLQFADTDPATVAAMRRALDAGEPFVGEVLNLGLRGQPYWLHLQIHPMRDDEGRLTGFVAIQSDVTERKRQEAALRDAAALLARTERIAGVGGWSYDLQARRLGCTGHVAALLGLPEGAGARPLRVRDGLRRLSPEDRRVLWRLAHGAGVAGAPRSADVAVAVPGREPRWLQVTVDHGAGAGDGSRITGSLLDVTQRRRMKIELRRSADLLRDAFEAVDAGFALFDPADRLVFCNDRYRQLYAAAADAIHPGASCEAILRRGAERGLFAAARGQADEWVAQRMAARRGGHGALVQRLADGRILRVIDRRMPDGHTADLLVDITELVRTTEAAESADRSKSEFIATISHELRTPLQVINGFSDLGRHFALQQPHFRPMFEDIHAAGQRMLRLVNGLLDVSKIDGTAGSLVLTRQALAPLAQAVARELAPLAQAGQVQFSCDVPASLQADVDAFRLQQVLRNLMANALRFAPAGSVIELTGEDDGFGGIELGVRDHGPGVPEDELESIFEPFVQSSRTRDGAGGTGLGLTICRRIMGAHGGRIAAELPPGGGTRFRLWLPPPAPPAGAAAEERAGTGAAARRTLASLRAAGRAAPAAPGPTPPATEPTPEPRKTHDTHEAHEAHETPPSEETPCHAPS